MIGLADGAAVLTRPVPDLNPWPKSRVVAPKSAKKELSPCARYAIEAVELLNPGHPPGAMMCVTGQTGVIVDAFDGAWRGSPDGRLTGPGFGASRHRRIHPFTLVRSLQNQVPAAISNHFQYHGPCLNALESGLALAALLPNLTIMLRDYRSLLLVFSSAADRGEERAKTRFLNPRGLGVEGAVCFWLSRDSPLGFLEEAPESPSGSGAAMAEVEGVTAVADPVLRQGLSLLACLAQPADRRVVTFRDTHGAQSFSLHWRPV